MFWQINLYGTSKKGKSSWARAHRATQAVSATKVAAATASYGSRNGTVRTQNLLSIQGLG